MDIKKNGFYIIKKDFFDKMEDTSLPFLKNGRPSFYCIEDKNNKDILWVIPMTTKIEKVNKIIEKHGGIDKCNIYYINPTEKASAFNIQDIFPVTSNYIEREYIKNGKHYILKNNKIINEVEKRAKILINAKMLKKKLVQNEIDVQKIYKILKKELILEKNKELKEIIKEISNSNKPFRGNYNALTGNEIITFDHASGDKRWLTLQDAQKNNIVVKENEKPVLSIVTHQEEEKLYAEPIEYYNVSQLNITKEIEQKFKPIKEKVKNKSKEKGIER